MGEPLARTDAAVEGALADAAHRLDRALESLETALSRPHDTVRPPAAGLDAVELQATRRRGRELESAVAEASQALGRAMTQVQLTLDVDGTAEQDRQASLFDRGLLASALESGPVLPDEEETGVDDPAPAKEPTA